eukprot:683784-Prymnesium_polylepis.1
MVDADLRLEAFRGLLEGRHHDARVEDEPVQSESAGRVLLREGAHRLERREVERHRMHALVRRSSPNLRCGGLALGDRPAGDDHGGL